MRIINYGSTIICNMILINKKLSAKLLITINIIKLIFYHIITPTSFSILWCIIWKNLITIWNKIFVFFVILSKKQRGIDNINRSWNIFFACNRVQNSLSSNSAWSDQYKSLLITRNSPLWKEWKTYSCL